MEFEKEIQIYRKIFNEEIDIDDVSYVEASKALCYNAGLDAIKHLFQLFDDNCYEISLMDDLTETIFYIADRYGKQGLKELSSCFSFVPKNGSYIGKRVMMKKIINSDLQYKIWADVINELDKCNKNIIINELERIAKKESQVCRKDRIDFILEQVT